MEPRVLGISHPMDMHDVVLYAFPWGRKGSTVVQADFECSGQTVGFGT